MVWLRYFRPQASHYDSSFIQQTTLVRQIGDRIRSSLELSVVLQTAVEEVVAQLPVECCLFLWYFQDIQRVQIVCEAGDRTLSGSTLSNSTLSNSTPSGGIGHFPLTKFGDLASAIDHGGLILRPGNASNRPNGLLGLQPGMQSCPIDPPGPLFGDAAVLMIPVEGQEHSRGYLVCLDSTRQHWSPDTVELMQAIAQPLEMAIRQAQLYDRLQKQARRERLVNQITAQTRQSLDVKKILKRAIAQLLNALEVDRCLVHLVEAPDELTDVAEELGNSHPDGLGDSLGDRGEGYNRFRRKHLFEVCREPFPSTIADFDTDGPITRWVIENRQQVVISDITQDPRIGTDNQEYRLAQIQSSLVVPVQANGTLQAILYLNQCSHIRYWTRDDQKLAQAVADQLAISIQQAHLYAKTRQQAQESAAQAERLSEALLNLQQTQAHLIQSEKMSSLGQLVSGIAHEINNPISFIYGNIPFVERYVKDLLRLLTAYQASYPQSTEKLRDLLEEIEPDFVLEDLPRILDSMRAGASRIREIVLSLRNFSRVHEANRKVVDLHEGLESTLKLLQHSIPADVEICRCYGDLPPVECFPSRLNQVFFHIIKNALEAMESVGDRPRIITLTTESFWHSPLDQPWVRVAIADTGPGIPAHLQPKIFDPFFTTKSVGQGYGLGLSIAYQTIVQQHQGTLECHSTLGKGTTFILEIPICPPTAPPPDAPDPPLAALRPV
ncbi:GAF domain-containing protein [Thermoleptolyngbya oregonensis NK1-22]|uniref:histidine kinase n=1 Tax=Thermoleptolyngbya oregonensis NK1-22 TaxID=2547457 RepID=A0AA96Y2I7_9CYAN|nr:GAF domain-containing protein [Thermoleptolyngbya oregonensis NK1-22]